jgi:hypothetical protein
MLALTTTTPASYPTQATGLPPPAPATGASARPQRRSANPRATPVTYKEAGDEDEDEGADVDSEADDSSSDFEPDAKEQEEAEAEAEEDDAMSGACCCGLLLRPAAVACCCGLLLWPAAVHAGAAQQLPPLPPYTPQGNA